MMTIMNTYSRPHQPASRPCQRAWPIADQSRNVIASYSPAHHPAPQRVSRLSACGVGVVTIEHETSLVERGGEYRGDKLREVCLLVSTTSQFPQPADRARSNVDEGQDPYLPDCILARRCLQTERESHVIRSAIENRVFVGAIAGPWFSSIVRSALHYCACWTWYRRVWQPIRWSVVKILHSRSSSSLCSASRCA